MLVHNYLSFWEAHGWLRLVAWPFHSELKRVWKVWTIHGIEKIQLSFISLILLSLPFVKLCSNLPFPICNLIFLGILSIFLRTRRRCDASRCTSNRTWRMSWRGERHLADCGQRPRKVTGTPTWPWNQPPMGKHRGGDSLTAAGNGGVGNYSTL